jgi:hypothetical protein
MRAPSRPDSDGGHGDSRGRKSRAGGWIRGLVSDPAVVVALLVLGGYFTAARLVENLYPFSTFPMYSSEHTDSASRIVALEADGSAREVAEYAAWSCEEPVDLDREPERCSALPRYSTIPYIDREIVDAMRQRGGARAGGAPVTIVRRVFRFPKGPGPAQIEDCALGRCTAVRR